MVSVVMSMTKSEMVRTVIHNRTYEEYITMTIKVNILGGKCFYLNNSIHIFIPDNLSTIALIDLIVDKNIKVKQLVCHDNSSYTDRLTIGNAYTVLEEIAGEPLEGMSMYHILDNNNNSFCTMVERFK